MSQTEIHSPHPSDLVALVGAGTVGLAILQDHLKHGCAVALFDVQEPAIEKASALVHDNLPSVRVTACELSLDGLVGRMFLPRGVAEPSRCQLLIESVTENLALKQSLFPRWRQALGPNVLLCSNTSNLLIRNVFAELPQDPLCCGLHFFMPVAERPLVECIVTQHTHDAAVQRIRQHAVQLEKQVLFPADSPGFVVNRLLAPYLNQSLTLLQWGVDERLIEQAALEFGMPMSPFRLIDTIGVRTAFDSGRVFWQAFPDRIEPSAILPGLIRAGRKSPRPISFYNYAAATSAPPSQPVHFGQQAGEVVQTYQIPAGIGPATTASLPASWSHRELTTNLALVMWIEALLLLRDKVVPTQQEVELAMSHGLGYRQPLGLFGLVTSFDWSAVKQHLVDQSDRFKSLRLPAKLNSAVMNSSSAREATANWLL